MSQIKRKKDGETLEITNDLGSTVTTISRAELQTQLDHKELDKIAIQLEIDEIQNDIDLLN